MDPERFIPGGVNSAMRRLNGHPAMAAAALATIASYAVLARTA